MNKLITLIMCLLLIGTTSLLTGCGGRAQVLAGRTIKATAESVDTAMKAWTDAEVANLVSVNDAAWVRDLHGRYQIALKKAIAAARFDWTVAAPVELSILAGELATTVAFLLK
jgi:hypothetical protein